MPIAPRFHLEQMEELATQLKRAPLRVRLQQIDATEALIDEIEQEMLYPMDYVTFRITGYRTESKNQQMLLGMALIGDLVAIVAVVSKTMPLSGAGMLTMKQVADDLGVSQRTVNRLKHEGLSFRWVTESSGRSRLGCSKKILQSFSKRNHKRITRASSFTRLSRSEQQKVIQLALGYRGKGRSLNDVAKEVSLKMGRGHETVRMLLHEDNLTADSLLRIPSLTRREARIIERAIQKGASWESLQEKYHKTSNAMRSAVGRLKANRLKRMDIQFVELEVFHRSDAADVILSPNIVKRITPVILKLNPLQIDEIQTAITTQEETSIVSAMHFLKYESSQLIHVFGYSPSEKTIDQIETNLRWSFLLQQRLILSALPTALSVATQHIGRPLQELPLNRLRTLVELVISTVGEVCGSLDSARNQTSAKTSASVLDRKLSVSNIKGMSKRAAAKDTVHEFICPFHQVEPWGKFLPTSNIPTILSKEGNDEDALAASLKFGWDGFPRTMQEIATEMGKSQIWVKRSLSRW